jgi:threonine synthase
MRFVSTRGQTSPLLFSEAVATGIAPDGGLLVPERLPGISELLPSWSGSDYASLCDRFFRLFASDLPEGELKAMIDSAYGRFDHPDIAPLRPIGDGRYVLELFHGPTLAFKDFALQFLGRLYGRQIRETGRLINVLGATSGDTGAAAIHGMLHLNGIRQFVLYPKGRISDLQERQMACTGSDDVFPLAIDGSFDDTQRIVKAIFGDRAFKDRHGLSAVNSINLARVLAQCVYYIHAWLRLDSKEREDVTFVVPTGNFGNVLAGWLCHRMGVPGLKFRVATNRNDILYRFFTAGSYSVREVEPSLAPSMDIQIASNFERYLYYLSDGDSKCIRDVMTRLAEEGHFEWTQPAGERFTATRSSDDEILGQIRRVHDDYGYLVDPHTACGFACRGEGRTEIVLATASPAKFPKVMEAAVGEAPRHPYLEELKAREVVTYSLPAEVDAVRTFIADHLSS